MKRWVAVPAASMSLLVVAGLWWVQYDWEHMGGYREGEESRRLVTISAPVLLADRQAYGQPDGPGVRIDPSWIVPSVGCGASGCHQRIYEQWAGSAHCSSADNALYRATVALGVEAGGAQVAVLCANCHDPGRSLTGEVGIAYARGAPEAPSDGVGCVVCHAITGSHESEPRNGNFDYAFGRPYPGGRSADAGASVWIHATTGRPTSMPRRCSQPRVVWVATGSSSVRRPAASIPTCSRRS